MNTFLTTNIAAATGGFDGSVNGKDFWADGLGATLATLMGVLGILVVVYALIRTVKKVADGKLGDAVKGVIGAAVLAVFLFQPQLINTTINAVSGFVKSAVTTISNIGDNSTPSNNGGTDTPTTGG